MQGIMKRAAVAATVLMWGAAVSAGHAQTTTQSATQTAADATRRGQLRMETNWTPPPGADAATVAARKPWLEKVGKDAVLHIDQPRPAGQPITGEQIMAISAAINDLMYTDVEAGPDSLKPVIAASMDNAEVAGDIVVKRTGISPGDTVVSVPMRFKAVKRLDADLVLKPGPFDTLPAGTPFVQYQFSVDRPGIAADRLSVWCAETREHEILGISYPTVICLGGDEAAGYSLFYGMTYSGAMSGIPYTRQLAMQGKIPVKVAWHDVAPDSFPFAWTLTYEGADKGAIFHTHLTRVVDGNTLVNSTIDQQMYPNGKYANAPHPLRGDGTYVYAFGDARLVFLPEPQTHTLGMAIESHQVRPEYSEFVSAPAVSQPASASADAAADAVKTQPWRLGAVQLKPETLTRISAANSGYVTFSVKGRLAEAVELTQGREESEPFGQHIPGFVAGAVFYRTDETVTLDAGVHARLRGWCGPVQINRATPPNIHMTCFRDGQNYGSAIDFSGVWETLPLTVVPDTNLGKAFTPRLPANRPHEIGEDGDRTVYITVLHEPMPLVAGRMSYDTKPQTVTKVVVSMRNFNAGYDSALKAAKTDGEGDEARASYASRVYVVGPDALGRTALNLWDKRLVITGLPDGLDAHLEDGGDGLGIHPEF